MSFFIIIINICVLLAASCDLTRINLLHYKIWHEFIELCNNFITQWKMADIRQVTVGFNLHFRHIGHMELIPRFLQTYWQLMDYAINIMPATLTFPEPLYWYQI